MYGVTLLESELGMKRMNPSATKTNNLKLSTSLCPCDQQGTTMKDVYSDNPADDTLKVESITVDGVVYPLDTPVSLDSAAATTPSGESNPLQAALEKTLMRSEIGVYCKASYASTTLTVTHKGRRTLSSINLAGGTSLSLTRSAL